MFPSPSNGTVKLCNRPRHMGGGFNQRALRCQQGVLCAQHIQKSEAPCTYCAWATFRAISLCCTACASSSRLFWVAVKLAMASSISCQALSTVRWNKTEASCCCALRRWSCPVSRPPSKIGSVAVGPNPYWRDAHDPSPLNWRACTSRLPERVIRGKNRPQPRQCWP